ncbi:MAG: iron ABC transporter permease [Tannerella sp.]|jgi:iron complex transport system permease protein|nr:iron ABC transporter permease [Tannerella sp.]
MFISKRLYSGVGLLALLLTVLSATAVFSLGVGRYPISGGEILRYLFCGDYGDENIPVLIREVRIPRIIGAILTGGALSVSGAVYQGLFRNPIVSPDILGVSSGAGFGAALAIVLSAGVAGTQFLAFGMGMIAVCLVLSISRTVNGHDKILVLVLSGMIVSALFGALISLMKYIADAETKLPDITFWLMGSFSNIGMNEIKFIAPIVVAGLIPAFLCSWKLNVLSFGEEEALTMGLNTRKIRITLIVCASLMTASVVSVTGLIGWTGLIVPHFTRFIAGSNNRTLLPAAFITGAAFMLGVDDLARSIMPVEIPLGIITSLIGAPLFFVVLITRAKN